MWRGVARYPHVLDGRPSWMAGDTPGAKFVAYPIEDLAAEGGEALLNWVLEVRHGLPTGPLDRSSRRITSAEARTGLAAWNLRWADLRSLAERSSAIFEYPMLDRDPLPRWSFGRVTLLGDAAHPMLEARGFAASRMAEDVNPHVRRLPKCC